MHIRYGIRAAVTWRIVAELIRRHQTSCKLRVLETHPCDGQYDCLSLRYSRGNLPFEVHLCDMNVDSQHLHIWHPYGEPRTRFQDLNWPDGNDYVLPFLTAHDPKMVVDAIEALLGLPSGNSPTPSTTPPTFVARVVAAVMERSAFSRQRVDAHCCWHGSSGMEGSYAESWISYFPDLQTRLVALPSDVPWQEHARIAGRVWKLGQPGKDQAVVLDMGSGRACWTGAPAQMVSLWEMYKQSGSKLHQPAEWVDERLAAF